MLIDSTHLVGMTEANQNFSKVTRLVDENGMAVIMRNNKPHYILIKFEEYDEIKSIQASRAKNIEVMANTIIDENLEAFLELAK